MSELTRERLVELLTYDPMSGIFRNRKPLHGRRRAGSVAGTIKQDGYVRIVIDSHSYPAHSLAWLYVHGTFPPLDLDHINRNPGDNRIVNLRPASQSQNQANRGYNRNNSTGYRGVTFHKALGKFQASIRVGYKPIHLGTFETAEDAGRAAEDARAKFFGPFAAQYNDTDRKALLVPGAKIRETA